MNPNAAQNCTMSMRHRVMMTPVTPGTAGKGNILEYQLTKVTSLYVYTDMNSNYHFMRYIEAI